MNSKKFYDNSGYVVSKFTKFSIGDIVNVKNYGCCYGGYKQAFDCMNGDIFHFSNVHMTNFDFDILTFGRNDKNKKRMFEIEGISFFKRMNWRIVGICLHEDKTSILYLLASSVGRLGLIIDEEGLILKHKNINEINQKYFVAN